MKISAFDLALQEQWAIRDEDGDGRHLAAILEIAAREREIDLQAVEAVQGRKLENTERAGLRNGVATIPITGPIFRYANMFTRISGATSIDTTARDLRQALDNGQVSSILLSIDSPGGTVNGTNELAKMIRSAAERKPVVAYVSSAGSSGAYWIATAAGAIYADETAELGSIGVVAAVIDDSKRELPRGVNRLTFVSSQSPYKRPDLDSEEGRAIMQARVDKTAKIFVEAVARNRGVAVETVLADFGQGAVLPGAEAVAAGMADGISSYEEVLAGLASGELASAGRRRSSSTVKRESKTMADKITAASIAADHPEVADALRAEGRKEGLEAGRKEGVEEGRTAGIEEGRKTGAEEGCKGERDRLASLEAVALPGFEAQLEEAKAQGHTAEQLAMAINKAQREKGAGYLDNLKSDQKALDESGGGLPKTTSGGAKTAGDDAPKVDAEEHAAQIRQTQKIYADRGQPITADKASKLIREGKVKLD